MKIGFIGLGLMGSRMAQNLLKADARLVVYNRTKEKAGSLLSGGAEWASTPAALGGQVEILFSMLSKPEVVEETATGNDGFLGALKEGSLWVDCSTVNPSFSRRMAGLAGERGVRFLDAPVTGSIGPAASGQLLFLVGGDAADVEACQPLFGLMGRQVLHVGGHGMGSSLKMLANLMLGVSMSVFSEAAHLGQSLGISEEILFDTFLSMPVNAPFLALKKEKILSDKFEADFPLKWMQKDLHLAALTGQEQGVALPLTGLAKELYLLAARQGLSDKDFSAIYKLK